MKSFFPDVQGNALNKLKVGISDDSMAHRINRVYCVVLLIILLIFSTAHSWVGNPISCWCPAEFKADHHVNYVNAYCWVGNTYVVPFEDALPIEHEEREEQEILYYQWVPVIFAFQAFLFAVPRFFWKHFNGYSGFDLKKVLTMVDDASYKSPDERKEKIEHAAIFIDKWIAVRDCIVSKHRRKHMVKVKIAGWGFHHANSMSVFYLLTDLLFLVNSLGQMFLLHALLGNDFLRLGSDFFTLMFNNKRWEHMDRFPLVTYCDFDIRQLNNLQRWTVQCSLPINLFNEKLFVVVWYLLVGMTIFNGAHLIWNLFAFCLPRKRHEYVEKYLSLRSPMHFDCPSDDRQRDLLDKFVDTYLRRDGVFVIWMVSTNVSQIAASDLVETLWTDYCKKPEIQSYLKQNEAEFHS